MDPEFYKKNKDIFDIASVSLHVIGAVQFCYVCYYDWYYAYVPPEIEQMFRAYSYKFKYITYWNGIIQTCYFSFCCVDDLLRHKLDEKSMVDWRSYGYAAFAFPMAVLVGCGFWCVMWANREMILPKAVDPFYPYWLNHMLTTNILVFQILETITSPRKYPSRAKGLAGLMGLEMFYFFWIYVVHKKAWIYTYPILEQMTQNQRYMVYLGSMVAGTLVYFAGEFINKLIWGKVVEQDDSK